MCTVAANLWMYKKNTPGALHRIQTYERGMGCRQAAFCAVSAAATAPTSWAL